MIFGKNFFDHRHFFERPIEHLGDIISAAAPRIFVIANSFGSVSIGHFPEYLVEGVPILNKLMGRAFNKAMRGFGYVQVDTGLWNNRPTVWRYAS